MCKGLILNMYFGCGFEYIFWLFLGVLRHFDFLGGVWWDWVQEMREACSFRVRVCFRVCLCFRVGVCVWVGVGGRVMVDV